MQQELIEMLEEIIQYVEVWNAHDQEIIDKAEALVEKAKKSAKEPAVPRGWKSVLIPTEWTIGPNLFKDWCSQWFGPDSDDEYLMHAAHALLGLAAPSQEPDVQQVFKPVGYLRSDEFDGHVFEPIDGTWPFDELLFSLSTSPEPVQEVCLTDEFLKEAAGSPEGYKFAAKGISKIDVWPHGGNWFPLYSLVQVQAIIAALRAKENKL